jgi:hypothetical protein
MRIRKATKPGAVNTFSSHNEKREAVLKYSKYILEARPLREVMKELCDDTAMNEGQALTFIKEVRDYISESTAENNEKIVEIHTLVYEDIYRKAEIYDIAKVKMKAMEQKEKLLQLYEQDVTEVTVNTQNNYGTPQRYDTQKLSIDQQSRLTQLLSKATSNE